MDVPKSNNKKQDIGEENNSVYSLDKECDMEKESKLSWSEE